MNSFKRVIVSFLVGALVLSSAPLTAQAGIVSTDQVLVTSGAGAERDRVATFLAREDVRGALQAQGVSPQAAVERVRALSDAEVTQLAARIDHAPAGGGVIGVLFTVFIVLLITDIFGLTKVFPFTRSIR